MATIHKKHIAIRRPPANLKKDDLHLFSHEYKKEIRATVVLLLKNVYVLRDTVFSIKAGFFTSFTNMVKVSKRSLLRRLFMLFKPGENVKEGIWIIDDWSSGYFHWLTDALPRLIAADYLEKRYPVLLPSYYANVRFIEDSLSLLKYDIYYYETNKKLKVDFLVLPSHTAYTGNYNKIILNKLRSEFTNVLDVTPYRKIFISRSKAPKRKIINEDAVCSLLKSYNYEIHYFEDYDFYTQIKIMNESRSVIGLHGAGLTNMLFMQKGGQVLELRNEGDNHNNCYFSLASDLEINYYYQQNKGNKQETNTVDITVDVNELKLNLDLMMAT